MGAKYSYTCTELETKRVGKHAGGVRRGHRRHVPECLLRVLAVAAMGEVGDVEDRLVHRDLFDSVVEIRGDDHLLG
jgi:hypothetical protein